MTEKEYNRMTRLIRECQELLLYEEIEPGRRLATIGVNLELIQYIANEAFVNKGKNDSN